MLEPSSWGVRNQVLASTTPDARLLPFTSKLGFGVGQLAEGITLTVFNTFVLFYFNQILGVSGTLTGIALGIALFFDAVTDPLAGSISDRLQTRWGRRLPMMAGAAVPMGLSIVALFNPPAGMSEYFYFGWLVIFAVLTRLCLTLYHIPHLALGAEMAQNYLDRTRVYSYSQLFGTLGQWGFGFVMLTIVFPTTAEFSHGMLNADGYPVLSIVAALGIAISISLCVWGTEKGDPVPAGSALQDGGAVASASSLSRSENRVHQSLLSHARVRTFLRDHPA